MKKILVIAPSSFPVSGAEAIVNVKLLKVLSDSGQFEIDLVSRKYFSHSYPSSSFDEYGIRLHSINTITVSNKLSAKTIWQHVGSLLCFGFVCKGSHWAYAAFGTVKKLIKSNHYDYVLTKQETAVPLGNYAKKKGLKWVATWNDPCPSSKYPEPYGFGINGKTSFADKVVIKMMRRADAHIFPSERLAKYMEPIVQAPSDKVFIIPHVVIKDERNSGSGETLRLIHSGNLYSPRSPKTFFEGLKKFIEKNDTPAVKFSILGCISDEDKHLVDEFGLDDYVECLKPVEYHKSLQELNNHDVAVIIEAKCEEGIYLPTKVSDFMQMQIPILSVSPATGMLNDLYNNHNIPYFADVASPDSIALALENVYQDYQDGNIKGNTIPEYYMPGYITETYMSF